MSRQIQYLIAALAVVAILGGVVYMGTRTTVYFRTPSEILAEPEAFRHKPIRVGALVEKGSAHWDAQKVRLTFRVTEDMEHFIPVVFDGVKPDMFKDGQGVVVEGRLGDDGVLVASQVLVKHSEEYRAEKSSKSKGRSAMETLGQ
ncbi:MAG: cytochrome c maturation protein CcmE [Deltaproteobacteria bacterium]|nr:cytochrome c maturation protein CcmE [Deltaproteobacteria bacterium]